MLCKKRYPCKGIFKLNASDTNVGDYININDLFTILEIAEDKKTNLRNDTKIAPFINKSDNVCHAEMEGQWKSIMQKYGTYQPVRYGSFDEYIIKALLKQTYPTIEIIHQYQWNPDDRRTSVDFKLTLNGITKILEFMGPHHFFQCNESPIDRSKRIEDKTDCEVIIWPYWIQQCSMNVKAIFDKDVIGLGALWGTGCFFGDMYFEDSASIILQLTERFHAIDEDGIGYFYEGNSKGRVMPQHPCIEEIKRHKLDIKVLIPKGKCDKDVRFWLPKELYSML